MVQAAQAAPSSAGEQPNQREHHLGTGETRLNNKHIVLYIFKFGGKMAVVLARPCPTANLPTTGRRPAETANVTNWAMCGTSDLKTNQTGQRRAGQLIGAAAIDWQWLGRSSRVVYYATQCSV